MSNKHELPDGEWVLLRAPQDVPERLRRPVKRALIASRSAIQQIQTQGDNWDLTEDQLAHFDDLNDLAVVALIEEWSFDKPICVDSILDLPAKIHDELQRVVAPMAKDLMPDFSVDGATDPKAPTGV